MSGARVLFVDDEPNIRLTMPAILTMHDFYVTVCATVAEALAAIQSDRFDVLIADLNIGQPGDGFTVVSAMRRTQPEAVTIILTGYPAFETALQAIRSQVDDYVVKPANVAELVDLIEDKLRNHTPTHHVSFKNVMTILSENRKRILDEWLVRVKPALTPSVDSLSDTELLNHVPLVLEEVIRVLDAGSTTLDAVAVHAAAEHGRTRLRQGFTVPMMIQETRALREVLYLCIQQHLLSLDVSYVFTDMVRISDNLDELVRYAIESYLDTSQKLAS